MRILVSDKSGKPARNADQTAGFTLVEVLVALVILTVGLTALSSLVAYTLSGTERARYLGLAATLASEKLEDLNRWPTTDPNVAGGASLTADTTVGTIDYFDDVVFASANGLQTETISTKTGGVTTYISTSHSPTGIITQTSSTTPPTTAGQMGFHRRWLIEMSPIVNGVTLVVPSPLVGPRRVTVEVTLTNLIIHPAVNFQMSAVRP
jgi:prepilin-type N-terminal cleavage/methylation domain-containing protein